MGPSPIEDEIPSGWPEPKMAKKMTEKGYIRDFGKLKAEFRSDVSDILPALVRSSVDVDDDF